MIYLCESAILALSSDCMSLSQYLQSSSKNVEVYGFEVTPKSWTG